MMPTLRQIKRLNQFLTDLYFMELSPDVIKFSHREDKPFIIITIEPIHDIQKERWFVMNWKGELKEDGK